MESNLIFTGCLVEADGLDTGVSKDKVGVGVGEETVGIGATIAGVGSCKIGLGSGRVGVGSTDSGVTTKGISDKVGVAVGIAVADGVGEIDSVIVGEGSTEGTIADWLAS